MYITTPALVLNSEPWSENDRIVTLYTEALGKVRAVAKGARKALSKINPHVPVGRETSVVLVRGQEFWRLTSAQLVAKGQDALDFTSWQQLLSWYRFWGRVIKEESEEPELWKILSVFNQDWWQAKSNEQRTFYSLAYTIQLLGQLGYLPRWRSCAKCQSDVSTQAEIFYEWQSGVMCHKCQQGDGVKVPVTVPKLYRFFHEKPALEWRERKLALPHQTNLANFLNKFLQYHFAEDYESSFF